MASPIMLYDAKGKEFMVRGTQGGDLFHLKRIPDFASLVMAGKVWNVQDQTTTVALVAPPTTTAGLTVQNPAGSGKYLALFSILTYTDVVAAGLASICLWHCAHKLAVTAYTRDISLAATGAGSICGLKAGQGAYPGSIILDRGATVVDDGWTPVAQPSVNRIASTNFLAEEHPLKVPVVIPPSYHYSLQTTATVVTYETGFGLVWAELDLEDLN